MLRPIPVAPPSSGKIHDNQRGQQSLTKGKKTLTGDDGGLTGHVLLLRPRRTDDRVKYGLLVGELSAPGRRRIASALLAI